MKKQIVLFLLLLLSFYLILIGWQQEHETSTTTSVEKPSSTAPSNANTPSETPKLSEVVQKQEVLVKRAVDGDTIELETGEKVRYIGINTTELHKKVPDCFAEEAYQENRKLVEGKAVRLEKDVSETDKYGRLLRYVYVGNIFVNDYLVKNGFAYSSSFPPDIAQQEIFRASQRYAEEQKTGLWAGECPIQKSKRLLK